MGKGGRKIRTQSNNATGFEAFCTKDAAGRGIKTQEGRGLLQQAFENSHHSFNKGRAILHSIFAYGQRREWCGDNPVARIETRRIQEKEIKPLSPEEIRRLEEAARRPEHREMQLSLHLMLYGGIRPEEVSRLTDKHIRLPEGIIIIPARCSKTGGGRVVPLRRKNRLKDVPMLIPRNWQNRWRALRRAAGFTHWQPDVCRHTFASYHAAHFRDLGKLQLEMGHRSADLLRSRYLNLPEELRLSFLVGVQAFSPVCLRRYEEWDSSPTLRQSPCNSPPMLI